VGRLTGSLGWVYGSAMAATNPIGWGVLACSGLTFLISTISKLEKDVHNNRVEWKKQQQF
jgi:hypothetical protein